MAEIRHNRRLRLGVAAVVVVVAAGLLGVALSLRAEDGPSNDRAGGQLAGRVTIESLPTLSYQAKVFTVRPGTNEITFVGKGGTDTLVFDDPALADFRLSVPSGPHIGTVDLQAGRDYRIGSSLAGHRAAGLVAILRVLPEADAS